MVTSLGLTICGLNGIFIILDEVAMKTGTMATIALMDGVDEFLRIVFLLVLISQT